MTAHVLSRKAHSTLNLRVSTGELSVDTLHSKSNGSHPLADTRSTHGPGVVVVTPDLSLGGAGLSIGGGSRSRDLCVGGDGSGGSGRGGNGSSGGGSLDGSNRGSGDGSGSYGSGRRDDRSLGGRSGGVLNSVLGSRLSSRSKVSNL
jgi:hypothetical protein